MGTSEPGGGLLTDPTSLDRVFTFTGAAHCTIPAGAQAVSAYITTINYPGNGHITAYPAGSATRPFVATLNFRAAAGLGATGEVLPLSGAGQVSVFSTPGTDLIVDLNGYYSPGGIVNSVAGLSGALTLSNGRNITITPLGTDIAIAATAPTRATGATGATGSAAAQDGFFFVAQGKCAAANWLSPGGSICSASPNLVRSEGIVPVTCTADVLWVTQEVDTVPATYTLLQNGGATLLICTINAGNTSCTDSNPAHPVSFAAGDKTATLITGGTAPGMGVSWRCK